MCASAARVRYTSFLSFQYTRYTPCATAIYLDRLMRSENLLLASQYHNYFISGSLIIRLFTAALRLRLFLPTFSPATRFSSLSFESVRVSKAFFIFASLPLEPRVSLDSLHFVNNATFVRPERARWRTARRFRDYFIVQVSTRVWLPPSLTHDRWISPRPTNDFLQRFAWNVIGRKHLERRLPRNDIPRSLDSSTDCPLITA